MAFIRTESGFRKIMQTFSQAAAEDYFNTHEKAKKWGKVKINDSTPLTVAARKNNFELISVMANNGVNLDEIDNGGTALSYAIRNGAYLAATRLLELGANPDAGGYYGTPLAFAVTHGNGAILKQLFEHNANPNNASALASIIEELDKFETYQTFISHGATPETLNYYGSLFSRAISHNNRPVIDHMLSRNVDVQDKAAFEAIASQAGLSEYYQILLDHGAKPEKIEFDYQNTLLHIAARNKNVNFLDVALKDDDMLKAINQLNAEHETPLLLAVKNGSLSCVNALLAAGADIDIADRYGRTPLSQASYNNSNDIAQVLQAEQKKRAHNNIIAKDGWTLLNENEVSHIQTYSSLQKRITKIFNFEMQERTVMVDDLSREHSSVSINDFADVSDNAVRKAFNAYKVRNGKIDEAQAFSYQANGGISFLNQTGVP